MPFFTNRGITPITSAPSSYTGPGDIATAATWKVWAGMRAFSAATAITPTLAVQLKFADTNTVDYYTASTGGINFTSLTATDIPTHGAVTGINIWYDQSGNSNHFVQVVNIPGFSSTAGPNSTPGITFPGTGGRSLKTTSVIPVKAYPLSYSAVLSITNTATQQQVFADVDTGAQVTIGRYNTPPVKWYTHSGGAASEDLATITDNAFHAGQFLFNGTSSRTYVDGVDSAGGVAIGTGDMNGTKRIIIGSDETDSAPMGGTMVEFGYFADDISSFRSALNANQHSNAAYGTW